MVASTGEAVGITSNSATIINNTFSGFAGAVYAVAVQYALAPSMADPLIVYGVTGSPFMAALTGLAPNTVYYYRAVVRTAGGRFCFGEIMSFVTLQPLPTPVVITGDATNITENAASIINNTYAGIMRTIDFVAVQYGIQPDMSVAATAYGVIGSPFAVSLTGLMPNTMYYYRAIVSASGGTIYGQIKSFVTPAPVPVILVNTGDATNITASSATIINNTFSGISGSIITAGVQYSTSPSMTSPVFASGGSSSPFSVNLMYLQPNTTYYYRAGVSASSGAYFGQIKSFTTPQRV